MRYRLIKLFLLGILLNNVASGQVSSSDTSSRFITRLAFRQLNGGIILFKAKVNDYPDSLNFILDTGSGGISLDSTTCTEFGIPLEPSNRTIRGIGGIRKVSFLNHATLHLPGLRVDSLDFHVNDYEILSSVYGMKIDGIIGYSFLSRYVVHLDYDSLFMDVFTPGEYRYPRGGHLLHPSIVAIPILNMQIRDRSDFQNRFYLDTGAGLNFLLSEDYVRDSAILSTRKRKKPVVTQAEGIGGRMTMRLTTIKEVRIGPYRFHHVPTFLYDDEYKATSYPYLGGLVGNDLLRRFNMTFNYRKREVHLIPNTHYHDSFDYAYTGLGIYYEGGRVVIEDVAEGSPGELSGFRKGDIIVGINNNLNGDLQSYKVMMQGAGHKLKFVVMREDGPVTLVLKTYSIR